MSGSNGIMQVLVDSNIFLRIFVRENERFFSDCQEFFGLVGKGDVAAYMPTVVVAEVSFVLASHYKHTKAEILEAAESMISSPNIEVYDDLQLPFAIEFYKKHNVKLIDCLLASSKRVQSGKASIVSYDRDFDKLGVTRLEPGDLLNKQGRSKEKLLRR